ncbi:MAG: hypothetical protein LLF98_02785 [Clostridium sp.]|uniref:hypothetical protein n=1 Tax=Clostridium sp. TaxID=1506 RepID=UPI0025B80B0E|nr:hypothetical protein [Clostridium sp.]MCE5220210.1 hypothetical protein [Clostridium sp.]
MFLKRIYRRIKYIPKFIKESLTYEYETCQECGNAFRIMWHVNDEIWNKVTNTNDGGGGSYCVDCFVKKAESKNIKINSKDINLELFYFE